MGQRLSAKRFFHAKCDEVVYFKNFLLPVILWPQIYQLLMATLPFKERYITHSCYQTNKITTDSKSEAMKGNVNSNIFEIYGNRRKNS